MHQKAKRHRRPGLWTRIKSCELCRAHSQATWLPERPRPLLAHLQPRGHTAGDIPSRTALETSVGLEGSEKVDPQHHRQILKLLQKVLFTRLSSYDFCVWVRIRIGLIHFLCDSTFGKGEVICSNRKASLYCNFSKVKFPYKPRNQISVSASLNKVVPYLIK